MGRHATMFRSAIFAACVAAASAFAPLPAVGVAQRTNAVSGMKMQSVVSNKAGKSKAMPFLSQPEGLDGSMAGDVGFDPLGFSSYIDVKWLREAAEARPYLHACLDWLHRPGGHPPPRPRVQPQVRPRGLGCCAPRWDALDPRGDRTHRNDLQQVPAHCNGHVRGPLAPARQPRLRPALPLHPQEPLQVRACRGDPRPRCHDGPLRHHPPDDHHKAGHHRAAHELQVGRPCGLQGSRRPLHRPGPCRWRRLVALLSSIVDDYDFWKTGATCGGVVRSKLPLFLHTLSFVSKRIQACVRAVNSCRLKGAWASRLPLIQSILKPKKGSRSDMW